MTKTKTFYWLLFSIFLFGIFSIVIGLDIHFMYKSQMMMNNRRLIGNILKEHPELESEIIQSFLQERGEEEFGQHILTKYGLDDIDTLEYLKSVQNLKKRTILRLVCFVLATVTILVIWLCFYKKKMNQKILSIHHYMNTILNDDYSLDIRDYDEGRLSNLKNDIYKLTVKLRVMSEQSIQDKKYLEEVLSDISHQLKTPLTSMYVINDLLENDQLDSKLKKEFLMKNKAQLERIEWLVTSLLKISRLDSGMVILREDVIYVEQMIQRALMPLRIPIELKNIVLKIQIEENCTFVGDENWLVEAFINIIKNAYEHTFINGMIQIIASTNPLYTVITIEDNGCGIPKEQIPHIFKRFYKGDTNKESIGIGLNMASNIIQRSNGSIQVESKVSSYTRFIVKFYKKNI